MADFSNIDVEKLGVAWEEEEDLWNISGKITTKKIQGTEHCFKVCIAIWIFPSQLF